MAERQPLGQTAGILNAKTQIGDISAANGPKLKPSLPPGGQAQVAPQPGLRIWVPPWGREQERAEEGVCMCASLCVSARVCLFMSAGWAPERAPGAFGFAASQHHHADRWDL